MNFIQLINRQKVTSKELKQKKFYNIKLKNPEKSEFFNQYQFHLSFDASVLITHQV